MTQDMPRPRPIYLHRFRNRHGNFVWYFRKPGAKRIRIRGEYGSPEFNNAYALALAGASLTPAKPVAATHTVAWLWDRYRQTVAWTHLKPATRRQRENIMGRALKTIAHEKYTAISKASIADSRDARRHTPAQARNFLDCMRGLFRWALEADYIKIDPTAGVKNPPKAVGQGFPVWTEDEIDRYHAKWPLGTKERVWIDLLLYTGLRRGDAVLLGRQHVRDGFFTLRTEKSGKEVIICNPVLPVLAKTLAAGPTGDLAFICGERGQPLTKESFGNMFRVACDTAKVKGKSAHGLRKAGATRAADNGASDSELMALFGWTDRQMPAIYTREANRKRLARQAGTKMERASVFNSSEKDDDSSHEKTAV